MRRRVALFALLLAGLALLGTARAPERSAPGLLRDAALRWVYVGARLMEIRVPEGFERIEGIIGSPHRRFQRLAGELERAPDDDG